VAELLARLPQEAHDLELFAFYSSCLARLHVRAPSGSAGSGREATTSEPRVGVPGDPPRWAQARERTAWRRAFLQHSQVFSSFSLYCSRLSRTHRLLPRPRRSPRLSPPDRRRRRPNRFPSGTGWLRRAPPISCGRLFQSGRVRGSSRVRPWRSGLVRRASRLGKLRPHRALPRSCGRQRHLSHCRLLRRLRFHALFQRQGRHRLPLLRRPPRPRCRCKCRSFLRLGR
jgi:hypothetical protein